MMLHFIFPLVFVSFLCNNIRFVQTLNPSLNSIISPRDESDQLYTSVVNVIINFAGSNYVDITQNCNGTSSAAQRIFSPHPTAAFTLSTSYIGNCTYTGVDDLGLILSPVTINVVGTASFVLPAVGTKVAAGSSTSVQFSYTPDVGNTPIFSTKLFCLSNGFSSESSISGTTVYQFPIPSNFYGSNCFFQATNVDYAFTGNSLNITVTQPLTFLYPTQNTVVIQPNSLLINLQSGAVTVSEIVTLAVISLTGPKPNIVVQTLTNEPIKFSNLYAGQYILSVSAASSYFVLPAPVTFFVKYALSFVDPPLVLQIGETFEIQVNPSDTLPPTFTSTTIGLFCNSVEVQSWQGVPYNQKVSLQLSGTTSLATGCTLTTISDVNNVFIPATTTVNIEYIKSPFGGNLFPITEAQLVAFLSQFGSSGW